MHDDRVFPFEKVARLESPERRQRQPPEPIAALIESKAPRRVLDVGVGTGYFAIPIALRLPRTTVVGVDIEPRMLDLFRQRAKEASVDGRVEAIAVPRDRIVLADGSVDVALLANIYHELPSRTDYLREVARVIAPGGGVVLCDWDPDAPGDFGPPQDHRIARETVEKDLATAGFAQARAHDLYEYHYVIEASRC